MLYIIATIIDDEDAIPLNPPPDEAVDDWYPFTNSASFSFAEHAFQKTETSAPDLDTLFKILEAHYQQESIFSSAEEMYATIDSIQHGDAPWQSFSFHFMGPLARDDPQWKRATYTVYCRNTQTVVHNMLNNKEFDGKFDYIPFQEYTGPQKRRVSNLMSGDWVYQKAVSSFLVSLIG